MSQRADLGIKTREQTNLQWEKHNGEADDHSDAHSHDDRICVIEAGNHSNHIGQTQSQDGLRKRKGLIST